MRKNKQMIHQGDGMLGVVAVAFVAALTLFFVLLHVEKEALKAYETASVWVAGKEIPNGFVITKEDIEDYFEQKEVNKDILPIGYLTSVQALEEKQAVLDISKGTILTDNMFCSREMYAEQMKSPVLVGVKAEDISQMVSGVLRAGDMVHIYTVQEETGARLLWEDVLVYESFDSSGMYIEAHDKTSCAARINLVLEKSEIEDFYTLLSRGDLEVVKVW